MSGSSVVDLRRVLEIAVPDTARVVSVGSGGTAMPALALAAKENAGPVLAFVDCQTASEPAGEMPRAAPAHRRICTSMRLDAERRHRLGLVCQLYRTLLPRR